MLKKEPCKAFKRYKIEPFINKMTQISIPFLAVLPTFTLKELNLSESATEMVHVVNSIVLGRVQPDNSISSAEFAFSTKGEIQQVSDLFDKGIQALSTKHSNPIRVLCWNDIDVSRIVRDMHIAGIKPNNKLFQLGRKPWESPLLSISSAYGWDSLESVLFRLYGESSLKMSAQEKCVEMIKLFKTIQ